MALSSIEGCTLGGLDEGRGHNTRILGCRGTLSALDISATSVHTVSEDGTVVESNSAGSAAWAVGYGHGITIQVPVLPDGGVDTIANVFKFTFGVVGTHASGVLTAVASTEVVATSKNNSSIGGQTNAVAAAKLPFTIQCGQVNVTHVDNESTDVQNSVTASISAIEGNTISVRLNQVQGADGADIPLADTDSLIFDIVCYATANN